jgi:hypothetical protein
VRHRRSEVSVLDKRAPLVRLLQDGRTLGDHVEVNYARQWPTFFKAIRDGYLDANGNLTAKGKEAAR